MALACASVTDQIFIARFAFVRIFLTCCIQIKRLEGKTFFGQEFFKLKETYFELQNETSELHGTSEL